MKKLITKLTDYISKAKKSERDKDLAIHTEKIYSAFYNTNIAMTDIEIAESLERVLNRIKNDLKERKQKRQSEFLETEQALDKF